MNASIKTHSARLPLFATDAFSSRRVFSALIDTSHVAVTPRVRDHFALRCVFSRATGPFASEIPHARRAR